MRSTGIAPMANFQPTPSLHNPQLQHHQIGYHQNVVEEERLVTLYVMNLSKDAVTQDFYFTLYNISSAIALAVADVAAGSLFGDLEIAKSSLAMKLMQEGRKRVQAFVTFPSTEVAHHALLSI